MQEPRGNCGFKTFSFSVGKGFPEAMQDELRSSDAPLVAAAGPATQECVLSRVEEHVNFAGRSGPNEAIKLAVSSFMSQPRSEYSSQLLWAPRLLAFLLLLSLKDVCDIHEKRHSIHVAVIRYSPMLVAGFPLSSRRKQS